MLLKVKSEQINVEYYELMCRDTLTLHMPVKSRPGEVLIVHTVTIHNPTAANSGVCYKVMRHNGRLVYLRHIAAINAGVVQRWATANYLVNGDEGGVAITANADGDIYNVSFHIIRLRDDEWVKE